MPIQTPGLPVRTHVDELLGIEPFPYPVESTTSASRTGYESPLVLYRAHESMSMGISQMKYPVLTSLRELQCGRARSRIGHLIGFLEDFLFPAE